MAPASRSRPWKRKGVGCGCGRGLEGGPGGGVEGREALEGEGAAAAGGEAGGDLGGFEDEGAGAAHRVEDGLGAGVAAGAEEEGGEGLAHRRGADGLLVAAAVEGGAGGVEADGAEVVVEADADGHGVVGRVVGHRGAEGLGDRGGDALAGGAGVVDARAVAGGLDAQGHVGAQGVGPGELAGALVELGEVQGAEGGDAGEDAGGAAQVEVGAPDVRPAALEGDAAGDGRRRGQAEGGGLVGEERLEAGRGGEEDLEGGVHALRLYQRPIGLTRAAYAPLPGRRRPRPARPASPSPDR